MFLDDGADLAGVGENDETPVPPHPGLDDHRGPRWGTIRTPIGLEAKVKLGIRVRRSGRHPFFLYGRHFGLENLGSSLFLVS